MAKIRDRCPSTVFSDIASARLTCRFVWPEADQLGDLRLARRQSSPLGHGTTGRALSTAGTSAASRRRAAAASARSPPA